MDRWMTIEWLNMRVGDKDAKLDFVCFFCTRCCSFRGGEVTGYASGAMALSQATHTGAIYAMYGLE